MEKEQYIQRWILGRVLLGALTLTIVCLSSYSQKTPSKQDPTSAVVEAARFQGSDCGSRVNAADRSLIGVPGEIDVSSSCGLSSKTPVSIGPQHILKFKQGGVFTFAGGISLGAN